jgi:hypothetical protein
MKQIEQSLDVSNKIESRAVLTTTKTQQQQQQQEQEQNLCNINSNDIKQEVAKGVRSGGQRAAPRVIS